MVVRNRVANVVAEMRPGGEARLSNQNFGGVVTRPEAIIRWKRAMPDFSCSSSMVQCEYATIMMHDS